jgi:predicted dehydrogenase
MPLSKTCRRSFIKTAAAVAGLPTIIPRSVLGCEGQVPPSERLTLGIVGTGYMLRSWHLPRLREYDDVQILAVCDVDKKRREDVQQTVVQHYTAANRPTTTCDAYGDFQQLVQRNDLDAVFIATPDHWHTIPAFQAMAAGKDVYCEKPLTLTIAEGKLLTAASRKFNRILQTGSQQRADREFRVACTAVRSGAIGKIKQVYVQVGSPSQWCDLPEEPMEEGLDWNLWLGSAPQRPYNSTLSPRGVHDHFPSWRNYREYSGGGMADWGAHHFDIAQWGLGMDESGPVEIIPPDDQCSFQGARFVYENGIELIHGGYEDRGGINFVGENGVIHVNRGKLQSWPDEDIVKRPLEEFSVQLQTPRGNQKGWKGLHRDWIECIRSRERPLCDVEIGARSATICHLGNLAYWNRRNLRWDPANWKFIDDTEANAWLDYARREPWQLPELG